MEGVRAANRVIYAVDHAHAHFTLSWIAPIICALANGAPPPFVD